MVAPAALSFRAAHIRSRALPEWERAMGDAMAAAQAQVRVLGACTPTNLDAELAALEADFARGCARNPSFTYAPPPHRDPRPELDRAAEVLSRRSTSSPFGALAELYAARARELSLEADICRAVGTPALAALAAKRYAPRDARDDEAAELSDRWLRDGAEPEAPTITSDDPADPRSLLCRMRAEVGRRRLAMRVIVVERLSSLAATGADMIYVASARRMTVRDVERTVLHEVEGHAVPRARAAKLRISLPARGTARGSDEQEGRALSLEERAGLLDGPRRRELARRHVAGMSVRAGAHFVDTVAMLREHGTMLCDALRIAARAHRGGGLARELVYLPAYLRVSEALARDPAIDDVLGVGQIALEAVDALRPYLCVSS